MAPSSDLESVGERVDRLLGEIADGPDPSVAERAEEAVRALAELYGAALARIVTGLDDPPGSAADTVRRLAADPLVASLLIVHGLHPDPVEVRITAALDRVRPFLGTHSGGVELIGIDDDGIVALRLEGSCHGCPSSLVTVRTAIERAVLEAAPEVTGFEVAGLADEAAPAAGEPALLQIGRYQQCPTELAGTAS